MQLTPEQVKGRIKNVAKENKADARTLMRIYMMERFLERVANSQYKDNFIIKGGMLVTAMVGVALRSTMDIDTSIKNQNLSAEDARRIVDEIKDIDLGDGVTFEVSSEWKPGDEPYYPVNDAKNGVLYSEYKKLADAEEKVIFGGRLGEYKYYDMDQVIAAVLDKCENEFCEMKQ